VPSKKKKKKRKKKKKKKKKKRKNKKMMMIVVIIIILRNRFSPLQCMLPVMTIRIFFISLIVFGDEWNFNKTFIMQLSQRSVTPLS
jgi:hypothetical protein